MGLAGFNRMRRERRAVEEKEAERFREDNAARWAGKRERDEQHRRNKKKVGKLRAEEAKAVERISAKMERAARTDRPSGDPLRSDHAAVMSGANVHGAQIARDPVERLRERIPDKEMASERLARTLDADSGPNPTAALVEAAREEQVAQDHPLDSAPRSPDDAEAQADEETRADAQNDDDGETGTEDDPRDHVRIPKDYAGRPAAERRRIAERLGATVSNAAEADEVIAAELERREAGRQKE